MVKLIRPPVTVVVILLAIMTAAAAVELPGSFHARQTAKRADRPRAVGQARVNSAGLPKPNVRQGTTFCVEIVTASVMSFVRHPLASTVHVCGRSVERGASRSKVMAYRLASWRNVSGSGHQERQRRTDPIPGRPESLNRITLLPSGASAIDELVCRIDAATTQVDIVIYAWEDDATGRSVMESLRRAALRGVQIRVMIDRASFLIHNPGSVDHSTFIDQLQDVRGVEVIQPRAALLRFDHRKLAIIDGRTAWTGGMIFTHQARTTWDNLAVLCEGPTVAEMRCVFNTRWAEVGGMAQDRVRSGGTLMSLQPNSHVRLLRTDVGDRSLKNAIYHAVDQAQHRIYLENCYFTDDLLAEKLIAARQRGVDVRVITTLRGNIGIVNQYMALTANRLLSGNVRVFLAPGMTHIKAMSVDGHWAYIGSANFDELSLRNNRELGLAMRGRCVAEAMEQHVFLPHCAKAQELRSPLPTPWNAIALKLIQGWL